MTTYDCAGGGGPSPYQPSSVGGAWSGQPPPHQHNNRAHTDLPNLAALGSSLGLTAATAGTTTGAPPGAHQAQLTGMSALNLGALPVGSALVAAALNQAGWGGLFSSLQGPQAPPPQQVDGPGGPGGYPGMNTASAQQAATVQQQQQQQQHQAIASVGMAQHSVPVPNNQGGGAGGGGGGGASGLLGWGDSPGPGAGAAPNNGNGVQQQANNPQSQQQPGMASWGQRDGPGPKGPPYTMKYD